MGIRVVEPIGTQIGQEGGIFFSDELDVKDVVDAVLKQTKVEFEQERASGESDMEIVKGGWVR
jgi:hypothetical protein